MRLLRLVAIAMVHVIVYATICRARGSDGRDGPKWPFFVNLEGAPKFKLPLVQFYNDTPCGGLNITHQLEFNGQLFFSRIGVRDLESYVIRNLSGWEWKQLGDETIEFDMNGRSSVSDWALTVIGVGHYSIKSVRTNASYLYDHCRIVEATVHEQKYLWQYLADLLISVKKQDRVGDAVIASFEYDSRGNMIKLACGVRTFAFDYDLDGEMASCIDTDTGNAIVSFLYKQGLLVRMDSDALRLVYLWGQASWDEYYKPVVEQPPVIIADGRFLYRYDRSRLCICGYFRAISGSLRGGWQYQEDSGRVSLTLNLSREKRQ
jgi:hypothetical protein